MASDYLPTMAGTTAPGNGVPPVGPASSPPTLRVVHLTGSNAGRVQELSPGEALVGRHPESRVRFDHTVDFLVSTRHGQFVVDQGQWYFVDTNSTNGSWVNGARVQRQVLSQGLLVVLGTPGAAGSASFKIDFDGTASAVPPEPEAAFAQEPPSSSELIRFVCQNCGAVDSAPAVEIGQAVECGVCGRKTKVVPMTTPPGALSSARPDEAAVAARAPGSDHPKVVVPEDAWSFGGIFGNVKGKINRIKERKDLQRQLAALDAQVPGLEGQLQQACTALGSELWQSAGAASAPTREVIRGFRATSKLAELDVAIEQVKARRKAAEDDAARQVAAHRAWLEEWQARHAQLEGDLALATQTLADAKAEQARTREAAKTAASTRIGQLSPVVSRTNELSAEAAQEPEDDFDQRYAALTAELQAMMDSLTAPMEGWSSQVAARSAAATALDQAARAHQDAAAKVAASSQEKAVKENARAAEDKSHQQQLQSLTQEIERIRLQAPPLHSDLGRQFLESADVSAIDLPLTSLGAARSALDHVKQAQASVEQKRKRLVELQAG